jgi:hypothetical protein
VVVALRMAMFSETVGMFMQRRVRSRMIETSMDAPRESMAVRWRDQFLPYSSMLHAKIKQSSRE